MNKLIQCTGTDLGNFKKNKAAEIAEAIQVQEEKDNMSKQFRWDYFSYHIESRKNLKNKKKNSNRSMSKSHLVKVCKRKFQQHDYRGEAEAEFVGWKPSPRDQSNKPD